MATTDLYTTVRNTSGAEVVAGFLPPHGRTLAIDEDVTIFGDVWDQLTKGGRPCKRLQAAFEQALTDGVIEIITSPAQFLQDVSTEAVKVLALDAGVLGVADPAWGSYTEV